MDAAGLQLACRNDAAEAIPVTRQQLEDVYERGMAELARMDARKRQLRAELKAIAEKEKLLKRKVRAAFRELTGCYRGYIHFHFHDDSRPEPAAIDVEAERIVV